MQPTQRNRSVRNVSNQRHGSNATHRTQRIQRNASDEYVTICMQRTQRNERNATDAIGTQRTFCSLHSVSLYIVPLQIGTNVNGTNATDATVQPFTQTLKKTSYLPKNPRNVGVVTARTGFLGQNDVPSRSEPVTSRTKNATHRRNVQRNASDEYVTICMQPQRNERNATVRFGRKRLEKRHGTVQWQAIST